ncbi:helix-turn-helix domain-containing protein [Candidatus Synechococcus calcipolaris G9]|uniref:Helix-turn-helix domain-containing protein n=1 Tax=Candidatus Synechococcus calcipolaris G9 TaxID=1497997 RepID=A0ABT6F3H8_9SYNE|nr:helix-turn-helix transcriptional regulator [Candidatus Synechococcus calcipolaris]MDG2992426.1 helix-turn-helix domain-containing protein [Candidatus Synechococcus calcipolaris G9]
MLLRTKVGLTQIELAEALGVTEATVRNWERGRSVPQLSIPQVKALCRVLAISLDDLPDSFGPQPIETNRQVLGDG